MLSKLGVAETSLVLSMFWWGIILGSPTLMKYDKSFVPFLDIFPTSVWSITCIVIGMIIMIGMLTRKTSVREVGLMLSGMFWVFMTFLVMLGGCYLHGVSYLICSVTSFWLFIRNVKVW